MGREGKRALICNLRQESHLDNPAKILVDIRLCEVCGLVSSIFSGNILFICQMSILAVLLREISDCRLSPLSLVSRFLFITSLYFVLWNQCNLLFRVTCSLGYSSTVVICLLCECVCVFRGKIYLLNHHTCRS